eukprot:769095-Ditylum_brightwellii.AAC.1
MAMAGDPDFICLTLLIQETLHNRRVLVHHLKHNPTSVCQLMKDYPNFIGYTDACHLGAGGVWTTGTDNLAPAV